MKYAIGIFLSLIIMQFVMPSLIVDYSDDTAPTSALADATTAAAEVPAASVVAGTDDAPPAALPTYAETTVAETADEPVLTVNLLDSSTGEVATLSMEDYLVGVVFAEMPASFHEEALKAQSVAARSYTFYKLFTMASGSTHLHGADVCNDFAHCQAYMTREAANEKWGEKYVTPLWEKVAACVTQTAGVIMTYSGQPVNAVFHAMSVGMTESSKDLWGGEVEYLSSVTSPESGDSGIKDAVTEVTLSSRNFQDVLKKNGYRGVFDTDPSEWLGPCALDASGRVSSLSVCGIKLSGARLRQIYGLRSAMFELVYASEKDEFTFTVEGYGHGVGMSQQGANLMAGQGSGYEEILRHYYTGVDVVRPEKYTHAT